ncbi:LysR substrate-binding domain-containing protein [Rhizobium sullae]|uniref:Substrate-binding domain-containing protein n=1 Tax=Rhizobium sullae TaxID=50338 RepID=A0ABY5XQ71_RHISU|nr:LysR substrate-binding domain-containing protein [Rhizobium sullae]UWU16251.1 substrate-binding domain-containing protein [Rhizobium sullae]
MLRISCSEWFGLHVLSPILAEFSLAHPKIVVELLTARNLFRREAELVALIRPFTEPDIISRKLMHIEYGPYAAKDSRPPVMGDGRGFNIVAMDQASPPRRTLIGSSTNFPTPIS